MGDRGQQADRWRWPLRGPPNEHRQDPGSQRMRRQWAGSQRMRSQRMRRHPAGRQRMRRQRTGSQRMRNQRIRRQRAGRQEPGRQPVGRQQGDWPRMRRQWMRRQQAGTQEPCRQEPGRQQAGRQRMRRPRLRRQRAGSQEPGRPQGDWPAVTDHRVLRARCCHWSMVDHRRACYGGCGGLSSTVACASGLALDAGLLAPIGPSPRSWRTPTAVRSCGLTPCFSYYRVTQLWALLPDCAAPSRRS